MPTYEHQCNTCQHEWEESYSIKSDPPETCPKCQAKTVKRLISGGSGRGVVELGGNELIEKIKSDAKILQKDAQKDEKIYSNLLGESRYQQLQTQMDQRKRR